MGCDHYLYLMRKPTHEETEHARKRLPHQTPLMVIAEGEQGWNSLKDIGTLSDGFSQHLDYELIMKDHNIPEDASIKIYKHREYGETFIWENTITDKDGNTQTQTYEVFISDYNRDHDYTTYDHGPRLYIHVTKIHQWRNNEEIRELIRKHIDVENCGYHILDEQTIQEICAIDAEAAIALEERQPNESVVYHEWY